MSIKEFCKTLDINIFDKLEGKNRDFLYKLSKYCVENNVGKKNIALIIINHMEKQFPVRLGRLTGRGKTWPIFDCYKNINCTSGSQNKIYGESIKSLSPMFLGPINKSIWPMIGELTADKFENYWLNFHYFIL